MMATLVLGSVADLAVAGAFGYVGWWLSRRAIVAPAKLAARGFHVWWAAIALVWAIDGARGLASAAGLVEAGPLETAFLLAHYLFLGLLCLALWGLLVYLAYLLRGRGHPLAIGAFYATYFIIAATAVAGARPVDVRVEAWATHVVYAQALAPAAQAALFLFLLVPQLLGAAAYTRLASRTGDPVRAYRVRLVGVALLVWIGVNLVADLAGLTYTDGWQVVRRLLGLAASLVILAAYRPPAPIRRRLAEAADAPEVRA